MHINLFNVNNTVRQVWLLPLSYRWKNWSREVEWLTQSNTVHNWRSPNLIKFVLLTTLYFFLNEAYSLFTFTTNSQDHTHTWRSPSNNCSAQLPAKLQMKKLSFSSFANTLIIDNNVHFDRHHRFANTLYINKYACIVFYHAWSPCFSLSSIICLLYARWSLQFGCIIFHSSHKGTMKWALSSSPFRAIDRSQRELKLTCPVK